MAWTTISNAAVAVGAIPSSSTVTALRDNPGAMGAAENGAPIVFAGWHPHDKVTVGDGADGLIYDFAIDGAVATIETPDFEDGYEYRIIGRGLSHNDGSDRSFELELLGATSGVYADFFRTSTANASITLDIDAEILTPRLSLARHIGKLVSSRAQLSLSAVGVATMSVTEKVSKARFNLAAGSFDAGRVYFLRRRDYTSSP